ncbi:MAG: serine O-acetyltransferase [Chloroflexi bacterium]|nr:serine O-acetyltransferase [Chloroflexota bacterium]
MRALVKSMRRDIQVILERDPAATSTLEVILAYPGFHARQFHRLAHPLWRRRVPLLPRLISHLGRFVTGIEIHPGARLGEGLFIDHGMGVVIGETAEIGENCSLYQGVTLGGTSTQRTKRHPTLGNNVVVGAGAKLIGAIHVGDDVKIGAGSVVVTSVPSHATVVGVPGRVVAIRDPDNDTTERLPDPEWDFMQRLQARIAELEARLTALEARLSATEAAGPAAIGEQQAVSSRQ